MEGLRKVITVRIEGQSLMLEISSPVVEKSRNYLYANVVVLDDWDKLLGEDECKGVLRFRHSGNKKIYDVPLTNTAMTVKVPWEVLYEGYVYVSAFAAFGDCVVTTSEASFRVDKTTEGVGEDPTEPSKNVYKQMVDELKSCKDSVDTVKGDIADINSDVDTVKADIDTLSQQQQSDIADVVQKFNAADEAIKTELCELNNELRGDLSHAVEIYELADILEKASITSYRKFPYTGKEKTEKVLNIDDYYYAAPERGYTGLDISFPSDNNKKYLIYLKVKYSDKNESEPGTIGGVNINSNDTNTKVTNPFSTIGYASVPSISNGQLRKDYNICCAILSNTETDNINVRVVFNGNNIILYYKDLCIVDITDKSTEDLKWLLIHDNILHYGEFKYNEYLEKTIKIEEYLSELKEKQNNHSFDKLWGKSLITEGDSITAGAGIQENEATGIKMTYGAIVATNHNMNFTNLGISGTTMGDVVANGKDKQGFSKENGRYTKISDSYDYLTIWFGWNDAYYGQIMKREEWLQETYGEDLFYPLSSDQIGTSGYANAEQKIACDNASGIVNGNVYAGHDYYNALYVGSINDDTNKTFYGALNVVIPYLIRKNPKGKIGLIVPYGCTTFIRQAVRDIGHKFGIKPLDLYSDDIPMFYGKEGNYDESIAEFLRSVFLADGVHPNIVGYEWLSTIYENYLMSL